MVEDGKTQPITKISMWIDTLEDALCFIKIYNIISPGNTDELIKRVEDSKRKKKIEQTIRSIHVNIRRGRFN